MLMAAREFNDLRDFRLRHLVGENAAYTHTVLVDMQHDLDRFVAALVEELLEDVDDELHRRVVVVQDEDLVEARLLGLGACFRNDAGPRTVTGSRAAALTVLLIVARVFHGPNQAVILRLKRYPNTKAAYA